MPALAHDLFVNLLASAIWAALAFAAGLLFKKDRLLALLSSTQVLLKKSGLFRLREQLLKKSFQVRSTDLLLKKVFLIKGIMMPFRLSKRRLAATLINVPVFKNSCDVAYSDMLFKKPFLKKFVPLQESNRSTKSQ